jgi:UDP-N-acetylglucosamine enolpyruvyl transferase
LAGLCARGETIVEGVSFIDRGYAALETTLAALGACIRRETD